MKIQHLTASGVHGYLPIDVEFADDLTFLVGLNGAGKTSALRLMMALLTINLEELYLIEFMEATLTVKEDDVLSILASKRNDGLRISIRPSGGDFNITSQDLELYISARSRNGLRSPVVDSFEHNPVYRRIQSLPKPMFLGIDRRFFPDPVEMEEAGEHFRRPTLRGFVVSRKAGAMDSLNEVNDLVMKKMQSIRSEQEKLDDTLRDNIFARAFEYKPADFQSGPPTPAEVEKYKRQLKKIEEAAVWLQLPFPEIQNSLNKFLDKMSSAIESLKVMSRSKSKKGEAVSKLSVNNDLVEWVVNKPQADRIIEHLKLLEQYTEHRSSLRQPVSRFLLLINNFLAQTKKELIIAEDDTLAVRITDKTQPLSALSSGERQLVVMLAHLCLNPRLAISGVFIVDEPEISLHIDWQEKFVSSIQEANPRVQIILATHSPAIILDKDIACREVSKL